MVRRATAVNVSARFTESAGNRDEMNRNRFKVTSGVSGPFISGLAAECYKLRARFLN
jgi:hypothetical protein